MLNGCCFLSLLELRDLPLGPWVEKRFDRTGSSPFPLPATLTVYAMIWGGQHRVLRSPLSHPGSLAIRSQGLRYTAAPAHTWIGPGSPRPRVTTDCGCCHLTTWDGRNNTKKGMGCQWVPVPLSPTPEFSTGDLCKQHVWSEISPLTTAGPSVNKAPFLYLSHRK